MRAYRPICRRARQLFTLCSALSLVLCVAFWVLRVSVHRGDYVTTLSNHTTVLLAGPQAKVIYRPDATRASHVGPFWQTWPLWLPGLQVEESRDWGRPGKPLTGRTVSASYWLPMLFCAVLPTTRGVHGRFGGMVGLRGHADAACAPRAATTSVPAPSGARSAGRRPLQR